MPIGNELIMIFVVPLSFRNYFQSLDDISVQIFLDKTCLKFSSKLLVRSASKLWGGLKTPGMWFDQHQKYEFKLFEITSRSVRDNFSRLTSFSKYYVNVIFCHERQALRDSFALRNSFVIVLRLLKPQCSRKRSKCDLDITKHFGTH